ncbi:neocarzinostatin apoprotein domain-containing protein [Streptomyces sp. NBC_01022]|uniref:neocarzinostatin apoprotein domain-containing protein n=1 Tax=Streptomyces sp. NBC_01022 TaxID=2903723 RepID=UPI002DD86DB7|nr:neocarzinostatin apoprotein domain-containing protein [Streptomyces sp. NBC_01022]WRZ78818.1 neocarzinostatin apoprotein domain-containing protein [Streptomyces sp. NBC_01022]WRZ86861.1 neocarzinostatin apoprotein domain-containing protein [Streptomyces sp. NBC_01022]
MRTVLRRSTALACAGAVAFATAVLSAPTASAAGVLTVSKTTGLAVGDTVTVSAKGLSASQGFAPLGLCKPTPAGPTNCETSADSAYIGKTDGSGVWHASSDNATSVKITIKAKAGGVSCTQAPGACVIAVFITATKEMVQVPLTVTAGGGTPSTSPSPSATASSTGSDGGSGGGSAASGGGSSDTSAGGAAGGGDSLAHTGSIDGIPVGLLAAGTLVLCGGSALLLMPRRRRD